MIEFFKLSKMLDAILAGIADALHYSSLPDSPVPMSKKKIVEGPVITIASPTFYEHPVSGDCDLCNLQLGKGRKRCPDARCGHIAKGGNAKQCKFCGHQFIIRDASEPAKKRRRKQTKTTTVDVGIQCCFSGDEPTTVEYNCATPTYHPLSKGPPPPLPE